MSEPLLTRYMQPLLAGRRAECFDLINRAVEGGLAPEQLIRDVIWPSLAQIERLHDDDRINIATEHMAVRINRTMADQLQARLETRPPNGRRMIVSCADGEPEELGAQIAADLFQADGWEVYFLGGGVPADEVLTMVGRLAPHTLLVFGTRPEGVPGVRQLVVMIRDIGVGQTMNIIVSGGIYNRADGLWQEVGADFVAPTATEALTLANDLGPRKPKPMPLGVVKKRRRRRRAPAPALQAVGA
jgi:methanogenic corrinoid protein MtbC1